MNKTKFLKNKELSFIELRYSNSSLCYKEHIHETLSIGAITNGKRQYSNKNNTYIISKGNLAIVNPNTIHSCNSIDNEKSNYYMLYIDTNWLYKVQKELNPTLNSFLPFKKEILEDKEIFNEFIKLCKVLLSNEFYIKKESLLIEFITILYKKYSDLQEKEKEINYKVENIIKYLKKNIKENISLEDLSKEFNLSTFYIIKLFKKQLNTSVYSYFINLKIEYAKNLLKKDFSIVETALECGFYDQSHFHRNFVKLVATTPKEYKNNFVQ
ncbi:AraC family transcriptional regulator [Malaciobacter mytili LMG 24559]|uniref:AraC family transcriptional regulator n=1 Tax=Malaciobacter mytili LMG 24559 TaxID=1032238 RepID=A0AAX2AF41_9BACT|nr:AraC family transcriptional regulator [Malaciobacter mytili]AXH13636.1 transcriptional regulator, AraC family [Malaciobacter mytili LMG 24559]RXK13820.1 AraC family transcriptional regulator [Malaciobacter mytili LMG 24559]